MARITRREVLAEDEVHVVHCINKSSGEPKAAFDRCWIGWEQLLRPSWKTERRQQVKAAAEGDQFAVGAGAEH
ncbi:MAG: hypothetical protein ABJZ55_21830 [Fuerstiella sp.]